MISILTTILTVVGSIIVAVISNNKSEERKLLAHEKLSKVIKNDDSTKLEVAALFKAATGIKMTYSDVLKIVDDDNGIWLVHLLSTVPGYVKYENGKLHYTKRFEKSWLRKLFSLFDKVGLYFSIFTYFSFSFALIFSSSIEGKIVSGIFVFTSAFFLIHVLKNKLNAEKAAELIVYDLPNNDSK
ncbi:hypothetical protein WCX72_05560 [Sulfurimonas sp. HSL1-6]|uniref:hypothetical protein n=1 Tax=Thiomicrolovo immobilis TaxID=3131935 RepID=UPI0031F93BFD